MKKTRARAAANPTAASLREMPAIDFPAYRVRRNPYAARIAREGIELVHDGPSRASLREMPEADFRSARVRRNPYTSRAAEAVAKIQYGRGRPRRGDEVGATPARSVRLPQPVWSALEAVAHDRHTTVHALLREVVTSYVTRQPATPKRR